MNIKHETILLNKHKLPVTVSALCSILSCEYELRRIDKDKVLSHIVVSDNDIIDKDCLFIPYDENDDQCRMMVSKGAGGVLTDHYIENVPCIIVNNIIDALYSICEWMFNAIDVPTVAVVGSVGKTTTKRMIKNVLETDRSVFCQSGNYNTFQAMCCAFQHVTCGTEIIVQEVDEKRVNNTANCSKILKPRIAVVTNIAESHIGFYGSKQALIGSFKGINQGMPDDGILIINGDDEDSLRAGFEKQIITIGIFDETCEYIARNIMLNSNGTSYDLYHRDMRIARIKIRTYGIHNVYNSLMAFVVGLLQGVSVANICKGLIKFRNYGLRQNISKIGKTMIYADCYNASATSVRYAIECFDNITHGGKSVLVLGDIAEIEGYENETYQQIAEFVNGSKADYLCTYGMESRQVLQNITRSIGNSHAFTASDLIDHLNKLKKKGYKCFLFKGSRKMKMEEVIKEVFPLHWYKMIIEERLFH